MNLKDAIRIKIYNVIAINDIHKKLQKMVCKNKYYVNLYGYYLNFCSLLYILILF